MEDYDIGNPQDGMVLEQSTFIDIDSLLREESDLDRAAEKILEGTMGATDILRKDSLDKFLDYVIFKAQSGYPHIINLAYPSKRIIDRVLEERVIRMINIHLLPDIIFRILKYLARNVHSSDTNLYLAYLITADEIIRAIYDTFLLFKRDIFEPDLQKKTLNVKRIQQFALRTDNKFSSPLDAASRFKYVLEYIALKQNVEHMYRKGDISLSGGE